MDSGEEGCGDVWLGFRRSPVSRMRKCRGDFGNGFGCRRGWKVDNKMTLKSTSLLSEYRNLSIELGVVEELVTLLERARGGTVAVKRRSNAVLMTS
jgi:hypothetical protein